ncbi:condensation domain-containing protein [Streptomyces avicenniae]|uniref:condensation domain-containing protein n=1 Tax=Streptomyces avicenniae TaxID=500153 RepID=UPI00069C14EA|nr:condensation domain-containing protein [Streptomyces avicenniae]
MLQIPVEDLEIAPGHAMEWKVITATRGSAGPARPRPAASYIQEDHFAVARVMDRENVPCPSSVGGSFEIQGSLDREALGAALLHFVRRHDVLRCVFRAEGDALGVEVLDPEEIKLDLVDVGPFTSHAAVGAYVHRFLQGTDTLRGPWFVMGAVERARSTTVYFACDHLVTDGVSTALVIEDIATAYEALSRGREVALPETGSYLDFAEQDRRRGRSLGQDDARLDYWKGFMERNGGIFPRFPLDLGVEPGALYPVVNETHALLTGEKPDVFEARCRAAEGSLPAGVLTALAVGLHREGGPGTYRGLLPVSRRNRHVYAHSMGWYVNTLPVEFSVAGATDFAATVSSVGSALAVMLKSVNVPFVRLPELLTPDRPRSRSWPFAVNFFSFLDFRKTPGAALHAARKAHGHVWAERSNGVFLWFHRNDAGLYVNTAYADTPQARRTMTGLVRTVRLIMEGVVRDGTL